MSMWLKKITRKTRVTRRDTENNFYILHSTFYIRHFTLEILHWKFYIGNFTMEISNCFTIIAIFIRIKTYQKLANQLVSFVTILQIGGFYAVAKNRKATFYKFHWIDLPLKYPPYNAIKFDLVTKVL